MIPLPPNRESLRDNFPRRLLPAGTLLFRVHRSAHEPVFYGNDGTGRFDPMGLEDVGVCYLGLRDETAFLEVFGRQRPLTTEQVSQRRITELVLKRDVILADVTSARIVGQFGLTLEISASPDYEAPQHWSRAFLESGFDGVHYKARHSPGADHESIALFGKSGVDYSELEIQESAGIGRGLIDRMRVNYGFPEPIPSTPLR